MFRSVRKKRNEISVEEAKALLRSERRGVFAVNGDDGYPYAIPINYLYEEESGKIFFHGAGVGHKVDALKRDDRICFTVYGNERIPEEDAWAPYWQSAVVFGCCRLITDEREIRDTVRKFALKYYPNAAMVDEEIGISGAAVQMFEISIEHISGKQIQER